MDHILERLGVIKIYSDILVCEKGKVDNTL
jgi:hypothetical protein